jgi:hypothetical protein
MKVNVGVMKNIISETNNLFLTTFDAWKKSNDDDLFVDDAKYLRIANAIPQEVEMTKTNSNIEKLVRVALYKLKCIQDMRESEPEKKYIMFETFSEYIYNCYRTYFLAEAIYRKRFTTKKILKLFSKIKIDERLNAHQLTEFINKLLEE